MDFNRLVKMISYRGALSDSNTKTADEFVR